MKISETFNEIVNRFFGQVSAPEPQIRAQLLRPDSMATSKNFALFSSFTPALRPTPPRPEEHVIVDRRLKAFADALDAYEVEANKRPTDKQHLARLGEAIWGAGCGSELAFELMWKSHHPPLDLPPARDLLPDRKIENAYSRDLMRAYKSALDVVADDLLEGHHTLKPGAGLDSFDTWRAGLQDQIKAADKSSNKLHGYGMIRGNKELCDKAIHNRLLTRRLTTFADDLDAYEASLAQYRGHRQLELTASISEF